MKVVFSDARIWRYVISAMSKFIDSALLKANDKELIVKGIDPSKTALIEFKIPKSSFETYEVDGEISIQLNLEEVGKVMKSAERDDKISITTDEARITFIFERRGVPRYFTLPLQTEELQEIPELSLDLGNEFKMPGDVLYEAITGIEDVGEVLWIKGDEGRLSLMSESDLGEAEIVLSAEKGILEEAKVGNPGFTVSYGMEYFSYMKQPIKVADAAVLKADAEMPAHLQLIFIQDTQLDYYVAPRAE